MHCAPVDLQLDSRLGCWSMRPGDSWWLWDSCSFPLPRNDTRSASKEVTEGLPDLNGLCEGPAPLCRSRTPPDDRSPVPINPTPIFILLVKGSWGKLLVAVFHEEIVQKNSHLDDCLLYTSPSPRDLSTSRMPSSA